MKLLDLFCGAGGAAMGYHRAGFTEIVGIDNRPQKNYPFKFIESDVFDLPVAFIREFDYVHASPPCQLFSSTKMFTKHKGHKDLLTPCRTMLLHAGVHYIIENVPGAPMRIDLMLCGTMFGLRLIRHRLFELHPQRLILTPPCDHWGTVKNGDFFSVVGNGSHNGYNGGGISSYARKEDAQIAMDIDWMYRYEMTQAIPPAYTEFIGKQLYAR